MGYRDCDDFMFTAWSDGCCLPFELFINLYNFIYYFKASGSLLDYKLGVSPDEFWSEERLEKWKKDVSKKDYVDEVLAPEDTSFDFVGSSFPTSDLDIKAPF